MTIGRGNRVLGLLLVASILSGCSVMKVKYRTATSHDSAASTGKNTKVPGVPFYIKKQEVVQETRYRLTLAEVRLDVVASLVNPSATDPKQRTISTKTTPRYQRVISGAGLGEAGWDGMGALLTGFDGTDQQIEEIVRGLKSLQTPDCATPLQTQSWTVDQAARCLQLVANRLTTRTIVDRDNVYFLNARHPAIGKGTIGFELREDQTLVKGNAEVDDQTLSKVLDVLPISEFLSAKLIKTPSKEDVDDQAEDIADAPESLRLLLGEDTTERILELPGIDSLRTFQAKPPKERKEASLALLQTLLRVEKEVKITVTPVLWEYALRTPASALGSPLKVEAPCPSADRCYEVELTRMSGEKKAEEPEEGMVISGKVTVKDPAQGTGAKSGG